MFRLGRLCRVQVGILGGRIGSCRVDEVQRQGMRIVNPIRTFSKKEIPNDAHIKSLVEKAVDERIKNLLDELERQKSFGGTSKNTESDNCQLIIYNDGAPGCDRNEDAIIFIFFGIVFSFVLVRILVFPTLADDMFVKDCQEYAKDNPEFDQNIRDKMKSFEEKERDDPTSKVDEETLFKEACLEYRYEKGENRHIIREWKQKKMDERRAKEQDDRQKKREEEARERHEKKKQKFINDVISQKFSEFFLEEGQNKIENEKLRGEIELYKQTVGEIYEQIPKGRFYW